MAFGIDDGLAIGVAASDWILNYNKKQYEDRIAELDDCVKQLDMHKSNLQSYRDQLRSVWNDDVASGEYEKVLDKEIKAVENAQNHAKAQSRSLKDIVSEMQDTTTQIVSKISEGIDSVLNALDIQ